MKLRVAINGFGRIGRTMLRAGIDSKKIDFVAINGRSPQILAYLLKYDSVYRTLDAEVKAKKGSIIVGGKEIKIINERDPASLPWSKLDIDVVVESTGFFTDREGASKHLEAGAKKVLISAPGKNPDITIIPGINEKIYDPKKHKIISLASCTTNCLAPIAKVLNDRFGIVYGFMTTVHAYTGDQRILDGSHKKFRRGRSAALSIVPTTSGATKSVVEVIPELKGRIDGMALRVPTPDGSVVDFVTELKKPATTESVNNLFKKESRSRYKGIIEYTEDEIVSSDIIGNPHSAIIDGLSTMVLGKNMLKVIAWYDNEWGYSCRIVDMLELMLNR